MKTKNVVWTETRRKTPSKKVRRLRAEMKRQGVR